jgi:hypothetical protein
VASWSGLEAEAPRIAARGRELLEHTGQGEGMLASVAGEGLPRIHPVVSNIVDGRLVVFSIEGSPKTRDLLTDGRYAFHTHIDPAVPHELSLRGRVRVVTDPYLHEHALARWSFDASEGYTLIELDIEHALLGERDSRDDWPPRYTTWHETAPGPGHSPTTTTTSTRTTDSTTSAAASSATAID